jgi:hypothetical protein
MGTWGVEIRSAVSRGIPARHGLQNTKCILYVQINMGRWPPKCMEVRQAGRAILQFAIIYITYVLRRSWVWYVVIKR